MKSRKAIFSVVCGLIVAAALAAIPGLFGGCEQQPGPGVLAKTDSGNGYRSPYDVAFGGELLAVSDRTKGELLLIDVGAGKIARRATLKG